MSPAIEPTPIPLTGRHAVHRVADILVDLLIKAGVDVIFGIPGGAVSPGGGGL